MTFELGRDRRLRKRSDFLRGQRGGLRVSTAHFTLLVAPQRAGHSAPRLGVVVARKVGGAVRRNRIKRLCRECFRLSTGLLPSGVDLIVIARPGADALGLAELRVEWCGAARLLGKRAKEALASPAPAGADLESLAPVQAELAAGAGTDHPGGGS